MPAPPTTRGGSTACAGHERGEPAVHLYEEQFSILPGVAHHLQTGHYHPGPGLGSSGTVITIAGNGVAGFSGDGGPATNAKAPRC